jgi:hypothetical protein
MNVVYTTLTEGRCHESDSSVSFVALASQHCLVLPHILVASSALYIPVATSPHSSTGTV